MAAPVACAARSSSSTSGVTMGTLPVREGPKPAAWRRHAAHTLRPWWLRGRLAASGARSRGPMIVGTGPYAAQPPRQHDARGGRTAARPTPITSGFGSSTGWLREHAPSLELKAQDTAEGAATSMPLPPLRDAMSTQRGIETRRASAASSRCGSCGLEGAAEMRREWRRSHRDRLRSLVSSRRAGIRPGARVAPRRCSRFAPRGSRVRFPPPIGATGGRRRPRAGAPSGPRRLQRERPYPEPSPS
jgi:hypothetical protein